MSDAEPLSPEESCARLGVDPWALKRLIALGELEADAEGNISAKAVDRLASERQSRRQDALNDLAALDGPHMGRTP